MSEENNNNETSNSKTNISPNIQDNITTNTNLDNKNFSNLNSPKRNTKKEDLIVSLISLDRKSSSTLIDDTKNVTNLLENETMKTEMTNKDFIKVGTKKNQ